MSFTIVPLHNLDLGAGAQIPFGKKFLLKDVPEWLKKDQGFLKDLCRHDRTATLEAQHALVSEYYANSIGYPDPEWKGQKPRGIQELRFQSAMLANMAIWLIQPSTVRFSVGFHALTDLDNGQTLDPPITLQSPREPPLWCHPRDASNPVEPKHLIKAAALFETLSAVPRKNDVWAALRAFWAALVSFQPDYRDPLFWQGIESLFGSDKTWKVSPRIRDRLSYFLAETEAMRQSLSDIVEGCYGDLNEALRQTLRVGAHRE